MIIFYLKHGLCRKGIISNSRKIKCEINGGNINNPSGKITFYRRSNILKENKDHDIIEFDLNNIMEFVNVTPYLYGELLYNLKLKFKMFKTFFYEKFRSLPNNSKNNINKIIFYVLMNKINLNKINNIIDISTKAIEFINNYNKNMSDKFFSTNPF